MKKLIVALLIATLCMVAPAAALDWDMNPFSTEVWIDGACPLGNVHGTYFDLYIDENSVDPMEPSTSVDNHGVAYPGWCVNTNYDAITNTSYDADLNTTMGISKEYNKINWVLNHKGEATSGEVQAAIWKILGQTIPTRYQGWNTTIAQQLADDANPSYVPEYYPEIGTVLVVPNGDWVGQPAVIEIPMPTCPPPISEIPTPTCPPPISEFPTMLIPIFLAGGLVIAASILKKE